MTIPNRLPELNLVILAGRLTKDAVTAFTQKGMAYSRFSIAVGRRYMDTAGAWQEDVVFVDAVLWGQSADRLKDRLKKGVPVMIEGRLQSGEYTDKAGQTRKTMQVNCRRVQILQSMGTQQDGAGSSFKESAPSDVDASIDDDVPF